SPRGYPVPPKAVGGPPCRRPPLPAPGSRSAPSTGRVRNRRRSARATGSVRTRAHRAVRVTRATRTTPRPRPADPAMPVGCETSVAGHASGHRPTRSRDMPRPRIALIITTWFRGSHADVLATDLVRGYEWNGTVGPARVEVVAAYLEQPEVVGPQGQQPDVGLPLLAEAGVPLYPTPAEALGCGAPGVNVAGVVIIGEHGQYEENEYGQQLYPRRRFFDDCLSAMIAADRFVPVMNDKHLAWNLTDARAMYDNARRLGVPLLAGSSIPVAWRRPQ